MYQMIGKNKQKNLIKKRQNLINLTSLLQSKIKIKNYNQKNSNNNKQHYKKKINEIQLLNFWKNIALFTIIFLTRQEIKKS